MSESIKPVYGPYGNALWTCGLCGGVWPYGDPAAFTTPNCKVCAVLYIRQHRKTDLSGEQQGDGRGGSND